MVRNEMLRFHMRLIGVLVILTVIAAGTVLAFHKPLRAWAYAYTGEEDLLPQVKGIKFFLKS